MKDLHIRLENKFNSKSICNALENIMHSWESWE